MIFSNVEKSDSVSEVDVCIIGAGISGVVTAKCLKDANFSVVVLEKSDYVGGLWHYSEDNYGVMRCTHM